MVRYLSLILLLLWNAPANGQSHQSGWEHIPTRSFSPRTSALEHQTWSVVTDSRGIIYVADKDGIKIFNGTAWEVAPTTSAGAIMSLAIDKSDRVFYGAQRGFGRLIRGGNGRLVMRSLSAVYPEPEKFGTVWAVHTLGSKVIFQAEQSIFSWDGEKMRSWNSNSGFHTSFVVGGKFYVREREIGLKILKSDQLQLIPSGDDLADVRVYMIEEMISGGLLVGTQELGLLRYKNKGFAPINSELDYFQIEDRASDNPLRLYTGTKISENLYAIGTLGKGVVLINGRGEILSVLNRETGLPDNFINHVTTDSAGGVWLSFNNSGIAFLDLTASLVRYGANYGVLGHVNGIYRVSGDLLLSTGAELLKFSEPILVPIAEDNRSLFDVVKGVSLPWDIAVSGQTIYVGTDEGLTVLKPSASGYDFSSCEPEPTFFLHRSQLTNLFLSGSKKGLNRILYNADDCQARAIIGVDLPVWSIVEEEEGEYWLGTRTEGVSKISFSMLGDEIAHVDKYSIAAGLPTQKIDVKKIGGRPLFISDSGPYRFVESTQRFELDRALWPFEEGVSDSLLVLTEDAHGNVWMAFPDSVVKAIPNGNGSYKFITPDPLRFKKSSTMAILAEEDDVIWFNDGDVLVRYDAKKDTGKRTPYNVLVNRVTKYVSDEVIFRGNFAGPDGTILKSQPTSAIPELLYQESELSILYAATSYTSPDGLRYQTRVFGTDSDWSPWAIATEYRVRSLGAGSYIFQARAKNSEGQISEVGSYAFVILPPWYFTWWAFLMYASFGTLLFYSGGKYWLMVRAHRLAEEQAKDLDKEREFNKVLQEANDRLIKANKLKDEFLATTSHELRTPLTSILGFTAVLKDEIPENAEYREFLDIIEDSGTRLMETLNSLLDLAKLRAGMMDVNLEICDIYYQCRDGISGLQATAKRQGLALSMEKPKEALYVDLDVLGFLRIIYNLVGNAIKFTEEGSVTIRIEGEEDLVHIRVIDTGIGIDAEFLPKLFDEFVQESDGASRTHEGFGLGLAITARLVRLMSGTISVESIKGEGSVFTVTLPRQPAPIGRPMRMRGFGVDSKS